MNNRQLGKHNIKRRLAALVLVLLMGIMSVAMTGCGGGNVDLEQGSRSDVTLSQALAANPDAAWFTVKSIDKDAKVTDVYYFEGGMATHYDLYWADVTLGQIGDMTREDIIAASAESWANMIDKMIVSNEDGEGVDGYSEAAYAAWKEFKANTKVPEDTSPALPYTLQIYTDSSGNYTQTEHLIIPIIDDEDAIEVDALMNYIGPGDGIILKEFTVTKEFSYGGYMGQVYDVDYGGFVSEDGEKMFITKASPDTSFVLDEVGTEGIEVDPKE